MEYKSRLHQYVMEDLKPMSDKDFFKMADENKAMLTRCDYHVFERINTKTYMCKRCNGIIDEHDYNWYMTGRKHEQDFKDDDFDLGDGKFD